jgi:hypothetical protein
VSPLPVREGIKGRGWSRVEIQGTRQNMFLYRNNSSLLLSFKKEESSFLKKKTKDFL